MNSIHLSQAQRDLLDQSRAQARTNARVLHQAATPAAAINIGQYSTLNPFNSGTGAVALTANGVLATSEQSAQMAEIELQNRDTLGPVDSPGEGFWDDLSRGLGEYVLDPVKGTVRWGMMGLMSVYESTVGGMVPRAMQQSSQDPNMGFGDALYEQQPFLTRALADVFRDPSVTMDSVWEEARTKDEEQEALLIAGEQQQLANVGSGWLPNSTVDPEVTSQVQERSAAYAQTVSGLPTNERYAAELEQSPNIWSESVAASAYQAALGSPITNQGYADREGVMFDVPNLSAPGGSYKTPYSPGRFAAATVFEPGTTAFSYVSGIGDVGSQIFLDPMNMIGLAWAKSGIKGRTLAAVQRKVGGAANAITDTSKRTDDITGFGGIIAGERNPLKAFGGDVIDEDTIGKIRQANDVLPPTWDEMLEDGVMFNDPNSYRAWKEMKNRVEVGGGTFDDIDQMRVINDLADDTAGVLDETKLQIGPDGPPRGPTDVPEGFYGEHPVGDRTARRKKITGGRYEIGDAVITKQGRGKWVVEGSDETYKTLKEAEASVRGVELSDDARKFADSGDDFFVHDTDELNSIDQTNRQGQQRIHRRVSRDRPEGGNAKVRVYGESLDLSSSRPLSGGNVSPEIEAFLRERGLWDTIVGFRGFSDDVLSDIPEDVWRRLASDGYGKIKVGDDDWIILDELIGGSRSDPMGRMFFDNGDLPISNQAGFDSARGLTPNQVNDHIQWLQDSARYGLDETGNLDPNKLTREAMDKFRRENAERIAKTKAAADDGHALGATIDGARPALDPMELVLEGKRKQAFINDLAKMSKGDDAARRIDRAFRYFDRNRIKVPRSIRKELIGANGDKFKIERALTRWIDDAGGSVVLQGGLRYGRMRGGVGMIDSILGSTLAGQKARGSLGVMGRIADQPAISRRLAQMVPSKEVNLVDDPDGGYILLDSLLTNYNVRRGQDGIKYYDADGVSHTTRGIEEVMDELLNLEVGDKVNAYRIMGDYSAILFAQAKKDIGDKLSSRFIKEITGFFVDTGRMHVYNTERMGMVELAEGVGDMLRVGGTGTYMPGPNFTTEAWTGAMHFPNSRSVKRAMNYRDKVGSVSNFIAAKKVYQPDVDQGWDKLRKAQRAARKRVEEQRKVSDTRIAKAQAKFDKAKSPAATKKAQAEMAKAKEAAGKIRDITDRKSAIAHIKENSADYDLVDRAGIMVARSAINKLWKPMVLLRGAWTVRIMIDDQMRVAAEGYDTIFNHPLRFINYAMSQPDGMKGAFKTGFMDLNGVRVNMKNLDEVQFGKFYSDAMASMSDGIFGKGAYGSKFATPIRKGDKLYPTAMSNRIAQLSGDSLNTQLAASKADDPVEEVVQWLLGNRPDLTPMGKTGTKYRADLKHLKGGDEELLKLIDEGDVDTLERLVRQYQADLHRNTGGVVVLDDGAGNYRHYSDKETIVTEYGKPAPRPDSDEFIPIIKEKGNEDLLSIVANGQGSMQASLYRADKTLSRTGLQELRDTISRHVSEAGPDRFPPHAYGPDPSAGKYPEGIGAAYDKAVSNFFDFFMSKPSNWLSRSPVFEQSYWRHVGESMPFMDEATKAEFLRRAQKAGMENPVKRAMKRTRGWVDSGDARSARMSPTKQGELNELIETIDEQAKAFGLAQVERTLFDLSTRKNISDSASLIFPFAEAWGEFISRWSRLAIYGDRNIKTANRFQQGINGLRESNPFDIQGDQGFFHQNDYGDEVFSYPSQVTRAGIELNNRLNDIPLIGGAFGEDVDPGLADTIEATASLESMNFASGVIPGFGPAVQIASQTVLNDNPRWDGIRKIIAPYGEVSGPSAMAPAWVKRLLSANKHPDPQLNATYNSTVQDILRTMQINGEFNGATTPTQIKALEAQAEERAKGLLMVRAAATFFLPSSPQYTFQAEDVDGMVYGYSQLGHEYSNIKWDEANGNESEAFEIFHERFGYLPVPFSQGRTYAVKERSSSIEGFRWERENRPLFDKYDATARFLGPVADGEFDYGRHLSLQKEGLREAYTAEQLTYLSDDLLGDMWMDNVMQGLDYLRDGSPEDRVQYDQKVVEAQQEIYEVHPYWNATVPGKAAGVTNKEQQAEVEKWMDDPALKGRPVVEAARTYLADRQKYITMLEEESMTLSGEYRDEWKMQIAIKVRTELRDLAERLTTQTPEFETLFRSVFASEVGQSHDGWGPDYTEFYGEDLFAGTLGLGPDVEQKFNTTFAGATKSGGSRGGGSSGSLGA